MQIFLGDNGENMSQGPGRAAVNAVVVLHFPKKVTG